MNKKIGIIIGSVIVAAGCIVGGYFFHNAQVEKAQEESISQINKSVSMDDYREAQKQEVQTILDTYDKKIHNTKDKSKMEKFVNSAKKEIGEIKTDAEITEEVQNHGIKELNGIVNLDDYREAQRNEIEEILKDATTDIKKVKTTEEADKIVEEAKENIANYKTDAEMTAAEAAARAQSSKGSSKGSKGCVGNDASNFY
ncbi:MAG: hypothetical protein E7226_00130 [Clostridiales bacterium]|nr:hypothetical protein [Clostridiales bacterium]